MKDVAIVGVGRTKVDRDPGSDLLLHMKRALQAGLDDAGLDRGELDGLMINISPLEGAMDKFPQMLGLPKVRWAFQSWYHGRIQPACVAVAAQALQAGQADYVACVSTAQALASHRGRFMGPHGQEAFREGGGPHLESPQYGLFYPSGGAALAMRKYFSRYGGTEEDLAAVAVSQREWAQLNPDAYFYGRPLSLTEYLDAPMIIDPLRAYDHCLPGNTGFSLIMTTADRAADRAKQPIWLRGYQGSLSGAETFVFGRTGLGVGGQTEASYVAPRMPVYEMAGLAPADIDLVGIVDAFSPLIPFTLEEFGFCAEGEGLSFIQKGRTAPGGELPVNTCGGGLSDAESFGWGHEVDMVRRLRGEMTDGMARKPNTAQFMSLDRSSLILAVDR